MMTLEWLDGDQNNFLNIWEYLFRKHLKRYQIYIDTRDSRPHLIIICQTYLNCVFQNQTIVRLIYTETMLNMSSFTQANVDSYVGYATTKWCT